MKGKTHNSGFWEPGFSIFADELAKEEKRLLAPLAAELKETSDPARTRQLEEQIAAIKADFKAKRKAAMYSLFAKQ